MLDLTVRRCGDRVWWTELEILLSEGYRIVLDSPDASAAESTGCPAPSGGTDRGVGRDTNFVTSGTGPLPGGDCVKGGDIDSFSETAGVGQDAARVGIERRLEPVEALVAAQDVEGAVDVLGFAAK